MQNSTPETVIIGKHHLSLGEVETLARATARIELAAEAVPRVEASRQMVLHALQERRTVYGVTTGFGALSDRRISETQVRELQINLLRSHAVGTGPLLPDNTVRLMLALRAHTLALGYSGVRQELIQSLLDLYNHGIIPEVPAQGSVGASGDLAPLAHLALPLTGEGCVRVGGEKTNALDALHHAGLEPIELEPKEALALINGTQAMTAIGLLALREAERLLYAALAAGALTVIALNGRVSAFDERLQEVRSHAGQIQVAARLRWLLHGWKADEDAGRPVQDRYSIRAMPQVFGAILDTLQFTSGVLKTEINAVTDNPLFFPEHDLIVNGANFHGHPIALACDHLKSAVASLATFSERRIASLVDPRSSNLNAFLSPFPGLHSGLMIPHYVAASLVSENRVLAHPASVDSLSTSADIEDYNSMGTLAARNLQTVVENASRVVAIESICASQAIDLSSAAEANAPVMEFYRQVREQVPFIERDQFGLGDAIERIASEIRSGYIAPPAGDMS